MRFRTERLHARQLTHNDLGGYFELNSNPSVTRYLGNSTLTRRECTRDLDRIIEAYADPLSPYMVLAIINTATEEFLGTCSIIRNASGQFEISYRFIELFWGHGYGQEITSGLINYCNSTLNIQEVFAYVHEHNSATLEIMSQLGIERLFNFYNYETEANEWIYRHASAGQSAASIAS